MPHSRGTGELSLAMPRWRKQDGLQTCRSRGFVESGMSLIAPAGSMFSAPRVQRDDHAVELALSEELQRVAPNLEVSGRDLTDRELFS